MEEPQPPLILCMENMSGEEVTLPIEPHDDFQTFLNKAKSLLGFDVDINSITRNQPVSLNDNIYQFLITAENTADGTLAAQDFDQMLEPNDGSNDLVYILDDGTQIRASQIHFDNEDPPVDLTAEKIPFVKYTDDCVDDLDLENLNIEETKNYNIIESPVSRWSSKNSSPKCSFVNSLPFKLVCNNTSAFEAQFTKFLEANTAKTYATLNPVANRNKSPRSLIKDNFKKFDESYQRDDLSYTREEILNMFKDSPVASLPYENHERRHVRKTDPSRLVHKNWNAKPTYVDIGGVLIGGSESQICFICGTHVNKNADKLYLFDNEDQKIHRCSPQKRMSTQLKIICEGCLNENFMPCRLKGANQFLNPDEYLVIRNNQQYIFQKTKNFKYCGAKIIDKDMDKDELVKVEIGSDGEIVTKPIDNDSRSEDIVIVKDETRDSSSDVEIIEPESEIDKIVDNLEEADEDVKRFLGKYSCDTEDLKELKCRFCEQIFAALSEVIEHGETHKHSLEDGEVYPCPLCNYGYANFKWLKGHLKAAHDKPDKKDEEDKEESKDDIKIDIEETTPAESSPIAKRTRSSIKKSESDKNESPEKKEEDEKKIDSNTEMTERIIKTEVKQECLESSDDEIWIVQTADDEASRQLQILLDAAKGKDKEKDDSKKTNTCLNCSQIIEPTEISSAHKCVKRRGRKRKTTGKDDNLLCIPTREDFYKRAQGRPRTINVNNDLLVPRARKKRSKEASSDPQIVTCHNCNESFTSKVRLKFHMQFHESSHMLTSDGQYSCHDCENATFGTETELFDHIHFQHGKQKRWQCPVDGCGKTFYLRATLTKHSRTHTDTRRYVCVTCGKRFLDKQTLDEHGVTHLQIKPFQCHICLKQLTRRSRLRMHLRAHHEELSPRLVLVCAVCGRAFRDPTDAQVLCHICLKQLRMHLRAHHEELSPRLVLVCAVCGRAFRDPTDAQVLCHICLKQLRMHLRAHHEELSPRLVLVCAVCGRAFRDPTDAQVLCHICLKQLRMHLRAHHEELSPRLVLVCAVCGRAFRDPTDAQVLCHICLKQLRMHLRAHHEELSPRLVLVCAVCGRAFRDPTDAQVLCHICLKQLRMHLRAHHEELSPRLVLVCAVCGRAFRDPTDAQVLCHICLKQLRMHLRAHHEELSPRLVLVCAVCGRAFRDPTDAQVLCHICLKQLRMHLRAHHEELSPRLVLVCAVCGRAFRDPTDAQVLCHICLKQLRMHLRAHHEELSPRLVLVCAVCGRAFRDPTDAQVLCHICLKQLRMHLRAHHEELSPRLVLVCAVCGRAFRDPTDAQVLCHICLKQLRMHLRAHHEELSPRLVLVCAVCGRAFRDPTDAQVLCHICLKQLRMHLRAHHEELSPRLVLVCAVCGRAFRDPTDAQVLCHICLKQLRMHLRAHHEELSPRLVLVCAVCGRAFRDPTDAQVLCHICLKQLRMHLRAHHEELSPRLVLVCAVCGRAFRDPTDAQDHATKSTECLEAFASELKEETEEVTVQLSPTSGLVRHTVQIIESPKLSKPIQREVSDGLGSDLVSLIPDECRTIIRVVEIEKAFRCEFCEDVFYLEDGLNRHRVIHKGVKNPFTCHICKVSFATYSRCTTHKTTHGFYKRPLAEAKRSLALGSQAPPSQPQCDTHTPILGYGDFPVVKHFLCEDCGRSYLHWTYLQVHRRMKHANENFVYKCNQCDITFPNSWSVAYHRKKLHGKSGQDFPNHTTKMVREDYRIPCRDCDEVLPNKTALYKHRKKEHSDISLRFNSKPSETATYPTAVSCGHCGQTFPNAHDLHTHLKQVHLHTATHPCAVCAAHAQARAATTTLTGQAATTGSGQAATTGSGQAASTSSSGQGVAGPRPHACPVCSRVFRTASMRADHLRTHTDERPYPCDVCGLAFRRSTAMRNHRLIHTGVRAWACGRCPKRFRIRSDLRTHLRLKHPAHLALIEVEGLNPTAEEVMKCLNVNNIPQDKVIEISMISFSKGSSSIIPNSTRALSMLSNITRTQITFNQPPPLQNDEFQPVRRGRGIAKNPRRPKILQRGGDEVPQPDPSNYPIAVSVTSEELSEINVQLLLRDGVLVNGNQMVQLQLDDSMLME